ncbi:hypothetical protein GCM10011390_50230 [Aureimonas endophytica]|uniref:Uncharacterized protein n=1 Tax=Aureimonas endophytica TaxID=2027858 RepID=A0A917A5L7_9HYPH|nr:ATP-binding protein [Aureimonas endophytica]GGE24758.1 hypothetical protein GCM10011390_50230 [Aureimonas endophytica]
MDAFEQPSEASLNADPNRPDFQYERSEWVLFRSVNTLPQKAGVPATKLRAVVLKELADNALDAGGSVRVGALDGSHNRFFVEDDGKGIDPDRVSVLFSINRPLISSKLWRLPTRGAMGNGLRVVMGAVVASGGSISVQTHGQHLRLIPQDDGSTVVEASPSTVTVGTRIELEFGPAVPFDRHCLAWARSAAEMASGSSYNGASSAWWYDADAFYELLQAAGDRPVRDLVQQLDGCSGAKAGKITLEFRRRSCISMSRLEAVALLQASRDASKPVRPERLIADGEADGAHGYDCRRGEFQHGARAPLARMPFVVEAWATPRTDRKIEIETLVNRTPIVSTVRAYVEKSSLYLYGCGLERDMQFPGGANVRLNITVPHCPITNDGKEPDLGYFEETIEEALRRAIKRARKTVAKPSEGDRLTAKSVVLANLDDAIQKASGDGLYRFNLRQLFYVVRPAVMATIGSELSYGNFEAIITDYEAENGDVPRMYRDPRGTVYHPHTGETIPLGTLAVEAYARPEWTFNKVLYIEKEGPFEALKAARWPERHDCALLTSKGFTTRAVKDLLDLLADDGEPITVFCIHDADAAGTMIYQTLQEETRARPNRRAVEVINLGLEPWEALSLGLEVEAVDVKKGGKAVARYVTERDDGEKWQAWLRSYRVELNAMTTPDFIAWLDGKMSDYSGAKVLPPSRIIESEMRQRTEHHVREAIVRKVLAEAGIENRVRAATDRAPKPDGSMLQHDLGDWLVSNEDRLWREFVDATARQAAEDLGEAE